MQLMKFLTLIGIVCLATLAFYASPTEACSCMPSHPQTHYCNADYVALIRVLRKSVKLVAQKVIYKVEVKKSYKMTTEGQKILRHGRIMSADSEHMCGVNLELGKLYVIAGRGPQLNFCNYAKEYKTMSIVERTGFTGKYRKGCHCNIKPCFGNRCLEPSNQDECSWSPYARCETIYSACLPAINRSFKEPVIKCRWRRTVSYDECMTEL